MIVLRTGNSHYFDEAYFVLRREVHSSRCSKDMLVEANRILEENALPHSKRKISRRPSALLFLLGIFGGFLLGFLLCLLIL